MEREREKEGGGREKDEREKKRSKTGDTMWGGRDRKGGREEEREREMTCIGSEKRVQNDHISVTGKLLSRRGSV